MSLDVRCNLGSRRITEIDPKARCFVRRKPKTSEPRVRFKLTIPITESVDKRRNPPTPYFPPAELVDLTAPHGGPQYGRNAAAFNEHGRCWRQGSANAHPRPLNQHRYSTYNATDTAPNAPAHHEHIRLDQRVSKTNHTPTHQQQDPAPLGAHGRPQGAANTYLGAVDQHNNPGSNSASRPQGDATHGGVHGRRQEDANTYRAPINQQHHSNSNREAGPPLKGRRSYDAAPRHVPTVQQAPVPQSPLPRHEGSNDHYRSSKTQSSADLQRNKRADYHDDKIFVDRRDRPDRDRREQLHQPGLSYSQQPELSPRIIEISPSGFAKRRNSRSRSEELERLSARSRSSVRQQPSSQDYCRSRHGTRSQGRYPVDRDLSFVEYDCDPYRGRSRRRDPIGCRPRHEDDYPARRRSELHSRDYLAPKPSYDDERRVRNREVYPASYGVSYPSPSRSAAAQTTVRMLSEITVEGLNYSGRHRRYISAPKEMDS